MGSSQSVFALIAAAFVTGIWAWIAQRAKSKGEEETSTTSAAFTDRQSLVEEYRKSNEQMQGLIGALHGQVGDLWEKSRLMQKAIEECEVGRAEDMKRNREMQRLLEECQRHGIEDRKKIIDLERRLWNGRSFLG